MKIKIIEPVPTLPSPTVGETYEVVEIQSRICGGGNVYMVDANGTLVGVLGREMEIVE